MLNRMLIFLFERISHFSLRKRYFFLGLGLIMTTSLVVITALVPRYLSTPEPLRSGTLTMALDSSLEIPIPSQEQNNTDLFITHLVFGRAGIIRNNTLILDLATSITENNNDTIITPRPNLHFHNGATITLEDIAYSLNEALERIDQITPPKAEIYDGSIVIRGLSSTSAYYQEIIETPWLQKELFTQNPPLKRISKRDEILASGSGPYKLRRITHNDTVTLKRVRNYAGPHYFKKIIINTQGTPKQFTRADIALQDSDTATITIDDSHYLAQYLSSKKIIGILTGKNFSSDNFNSLHHIVATTPLPSLELGSKQISTLPFDAMSRTKDAVLETIKPDSVRNFELRYPDTAYFKTLATAIAQQAQATGNPITITPIKPYTLKALLAERNFDGLLYGYEPEAITDIPLFFKSTQTYPTGLNIFGISSPALDNLLTMPLNQTTFSTIHERIMDTKKLIPFVSPHIILFAKKSIHGIIIYDKDRSVDLFEEPRFWYTSQKYIW